MSLCMKETEREDYVSDWSKDGDDDDDVMQLTALT